MSSAPATMSSARPTAFCYSNVKPSKPASKVRLRWSPHTAAPVVVPFADVERQRVCNVWG